MELWSPSFDHSPRVPSWWIFKSKHVLESQDDVLESSFSGIVPKISSKWWISPTNGRYFREFPQSNLWSRAKDLVPARSAIMPTTWAMYIGRLSLKGTWKGILEVSAFLVYYITILCSSTSQFATKPSGHWSRTSEGMDSVICLLMVVTSNQRVRRGPHTNG